jgi:hypothetical protein
VETKIYINPKKFVEHKQEIMSDKQVETYDEKYRNDLKEYT